MKRQCIAVPILVLSWGLISLATDSSIVSDTVDLSAQQTAMTDRALAFTGFGVKGESSATLSGGAVTRTIADSIVPFAEGSDGELPVWEVVLGEVKYTSDGVCSRERTCTVWLDTNGAFLQARIQPIDRPEWPRMPSKDQLESIFAGCFFTYHGLCTTAPAFDMDRIFRIPTDCDPCLSAETVVWCLMLSHHGRPPEPCWCVVDRGVPFQEISGSLRRKPLEPGLRTNYMCIYDATTGAPLTDVTVP